MVSTRSLALILSALSLVALVPEGTEAASQKSCRQCTCYITWHGILPAQKGLETTKKLQGMWDRYIPDITGGDGAEWKIIPVQGAGWQGKSYVPRMCGNGPGFNFRGRAEPVFERRPTWFDGKCECDPSVQCLKGSHCENSGL